MANLSIEKRTAESAEDAEKYKNSVLSALSAVKLVFSIQSPMNREQLREEIHKLYRAEHEALGEDGTLRLLEFQL